MAASTVAMRLQRAAYSTATSGMAKDTIAFIGLGQMGYKMAGNLFRKSPSSSFVIYDVMKGSTQKFVSEFQDKGRITVAATPRELAESAGIIVTMLPASAHVRDVYTNAKTGLTKVDLQGKLLIDSSTIDPRTSKHVAEAVIEKNGTAVDAPVSGGTLGAEAATLTFMVGTTEEAHFELVKPVLAKMGKNIVYCGPNGNGQVAKICNNMLLGISMVAAAETMNLGVRLGMDAKLLAGIINTSSGRCWSTDTYNPCPGVMPNVPASRDYEGGFGTTLMAKDMGLAVMAANESKSTVTLGAVTHQIYNQVSSTNGYEKKDFSSVFKWLNDNSQLYK